MKLYLARHGKTQWNDEDKFQGHMDIPLNDRGWAQARLLAGRLAREKSIKRLYCSQLQRAVETAVVVGKSLDLKPLRIQGIQEIHVGRWGGRPMAEIKEAGDHWKRYSEDFEFEIPGGGESRLQVRKRAVEAVTPLLEARDDILIISHGVVISIIMCELIGLELFHSSKFIMSNGGLSILEYDPDKGGIVVTWNDVSHLYEGAG